jgi:hypothetical protein
MEGAALRAIGAPFGERGEIEAVGRKSVVLGPRTCDISQFRGLEIAIRCNYVE